MQPTNLFFSFLVELIKRLKTAKPKFFIYLQDAALVLGAITGIPAFLEQYNIVLPPAVTMFENKFVAAATVGFLIASQLTSQSTINSISPQGPVNKQTNPVALPFTAKMEEKQAIKEGKPTEVAPPVQTKP